jgi:pimeloyl-ACP methyl ester carboxylesterase
MEANVETRTEGVTHHMARANGIRIHYVMAGRGEPVVLLHGFAQTCREWQRRVIPALAERYTVIAPDLRGAGDSEKPPSGYDKKTMAEDIYQLVRHELGFNRIFLVGHDFGAHTAYAYAGAHREEVRRLVILDTILAGFGYEEAMRHPFATDGLGRAIWHIGFLDSPYGIPEALISGRERMFLSWFHRNFAYDPTAIPEEDLDEYVRCYSSPGGLNALQYYSTHYEDAEHFRKLAQTKLRMPVLALGGEAFLGEGVREWMKPLAVDVRGRAIARCGHWIAEERPDELIRELQAFFAEETRA